MTCAAARHAHEGTIMLRLAELRCTASSGYDNTSNRLAGLSNPVVDSWRTWLQLRALTQHMFKMSVTLLTCLLETHNKLTGRTCASARVSNPSSTLLPWLGAYLSGHSTRKQNCRARWSAFHTVQHNCRIPKCALGLVSCEHSNIHPATAA